MVIERREHWGRTGLLAGHRCEQGPGRFPAPQRIGAEIPGSHAPPPMTGILPGDGISWRRSRQLESHLSGPEYGQLLMRPDCCPGQRLCSRGKRLARLPASTTVMECGRIRQDLGKSPHTRRGQDRRQYDRELANPAAGVYAARPLRVEMFASGAGTSGRVACYLEAR